MFAATTLLGGAGPSVADHEAFWAEWALRIQTLEQGIEQARQQGISLSRAKRVLKELQAQANAAEAASKLETVLQRRPCKASALKVSSCAPCARLHSLMLCCSLLYKASINTIRDYQLLSLRLIPCMGIACWHTA